MKYIIHGKCKKCGLEGLANELYKHGRKTHGDNFSVELNKEEITNTLIQISLKTIVDDALSKDSYDSIADKLSDWEGNDIYNLISDEYYPDDVVDVIDYLKTKDSLIKEQFLAHMKNFKIELTPKKELTL